MRIKDSAIVAAAVLSHRYITNRFLPDKAIDLVDEAGAALKIQIGSMPIEIDNLERRISHLEIERRCSESGERRRLERLVYATSKMSSNGCAAKRLALKETLVARKERHRSRPSTSSRRGRSRVRTEEEAATRAGDWEKASQLRYGKLAEIEQALNAANHEIELKSGDALLKEEIDEEDIAKIVAKWTGIRVARMLEGEVQKLIHMETRLEQARDRAERRSSWPGRLMRFAATVPD